MKTIKELRVDNRVLEVGAVFFTELQKELQRRKAYIKAYSQGVYKEKDRREKI